MGIAALVQYCGIGGEKPKVFHLGKGYAHLLCVSHIEPDFALDSKSVDSCLRNW